jgi:hypothetical protein
MITYFKWKLESYKGMLKFVQDHTSVSTDITEMADDVTALTNTVSQIEAAKGTQEDPIDGITQETKDKKLLMAKTVICIANKARPLARKVSNWELFAKLDFSISYISQAPKVDAISRAKGIQEAIVTNSAIFTNVKPADITAVQTTISDYETSHVKPRAARDLKKATGTDVLPELYKKANNVAENIFDFIHGYYDMTNAALVDEFDLACGIEKEGVHHTTLKATMVDIHPPAGAITQLIQDVEMKIVELNKTTKSDINGIAEIQKFVNGTYHLEFSKTGFVTKTMIVFVKRGQTVELEVEMERVSA